MSKKQTIHIRKFLRSNVRRLSPEVIEEIRNIQNNISNAQHIIYKKHHIGSTTYQKIIDNQRPSELIEEWHRIIESVNISNQILENNQESSHDTSSSTNIQEDGIIHMKHYADDENDPNSHINSNSLNTITNGRKDKVS